MTVRQLRDNNTAPPCARPVQASSHNSEDSQPFGITNDLGTGLGHSSLLNGIFLLTLRLNRSRTYLWRNVVKRFVLLLIPMFTATLLAHETINAEAPQNPSRLIGFFIERGRPESLSSKLVRKFINRYADFLEPGFAAGFSFIPN